MKSTSVCVNFWTEESTGILKLMNIFLPDEFYQMCLFLWRRHTIHLFSTGDGLTLWFEWVFYIRFYTIETR